MKPKVLIVEDDDQSREAIKKYLFKRSFEIQEASGESEAIVKGRQFKPDILIADWMLFPDGDGVEIARELKKHNPKIKIIMITAYRVQKLLLQLEQIGGMVLEKPLSLKYLYHLLKEDEIIN